MIALFLFWISLVALIYTYIIYPVLLAVLASGKTPNQVVFSKAGKLPEVTVLMAVHNEDKVLRDKLLSVIGNIPPNLSLEIIVGSDASTDNTNAILDDIASGTGILKKVIYSERRGKASIINDLSKMSESDILIITDANVLFDKDTVIKLIRHFKNPDIGLVDSNMKHKGVRKAGISVQEDAYIVREVKIKYFESIIWGTMMGPFGGCYAIRRKLLPEVPAGFLVDDFYINMKVILAGFKSVIDEGALVYEDVSNSLSEEFRRKTRIATGNFQNLKHFCHALYSRIPGLSFCFFSHKVLRWVGPFFMLILFFSTLVLSNRDLFYLYMLYFQAVIIASPLFDYLLGKFKMHVIILRFVSYFISMNFALLAGFVNFLKGVKSNVWQPTRRNQ